MYDIDTEKLIKAVKSRPPLYNKNDKFHHGHRKNKEKMWKELFQELNPKWNQMSAVDKAEYGREIQKRWKSLRTCFTRELALQRKENLKKESDEPVKRRKRYEYFNALTFIADDNDGNEGRDTQDSDDESTDHIDSYQGKVCDFAETSRSEDVVQIKLENEVENYPQTEIIYDRSTSHNVQERILDMLKDIKSDENDDDRQFILSLIPSFRKIIPRKKLEAKIEMLKVIQAFQYDK